MISEEKYTCCKCDADMTAAVLKKCNAREKKGGGKGPYPLAVDMKDKVTIISVRAQCPNGHWCEYFCTKRDKN